MHVGQCLDENYISGFCVLSGLKKPFFILSCVCVVLCCFQFGLFTFGFCFVLFFYCVNMLLGSSANLLINLIFFWGILASFVSLKTSEQLISSEIFWSCLYLMLISLL